MGKIVRFFLRLNFTPNTLGCYGLKGLKRNFIFYFVSFQRVLLRNVGPASIILGVQILSGSQFIFRNPSP